MDAKARHIRSERKRRRARRELANLLARQDYKCIYCECVIVPRVIFEKLELHKGITVKQTANIRLATIEHRQALVMGGGNHQTNLAACCGPCNRKRNRTLQRALKLFKK